jgi:hypothetical protein
MKMMMGSTWIAKEKSPGIKPPKTNSTPAST